MKRTNMLIFGAAGIVAAVLAISVFAQATLSEEIEEVYIPFAVDIDPDEIEIERGETLEKMVLVEAQNGAELDLDLEVYPYEEDDAGNVSTEAKDKTPKIKLDKIKVKISKDSKKVKDLGLGKEMKDSGASITISVPADAPLGTYTYMLDAKSKNAEGVALGSGELFTVIVK